jgi:protein-tyrosine phosphatase
MDRIHPHRLWIGHAGDSRNYSQILESGIKAVVQVAFEELPLQPPRELAYLRFPLVDGDCNDANLISLAIIAVTTLIKSRVPTLVCCAAGMSRSPAIAAAALAVANGDSLESSLSHVARYRRADVSPALWSEIRELLSSQPGGVESQDTRDP